MAKMVKVKEKTFGAMVKRIQSLTNIVKLYEQEIKELRKWQKKQKLR